VRILEGDARQAHPESMMNRNAMIAAAMALALPAKPVLACAMVSVPTPGRVIAAEAPAAAVTHAAPLFMPVAMVPVAARESGAVALAVQQREAVASLLRKAGSTPAEAQRQAGQLTADDLAVLAANPKMVQPAGEMDELTKNLIWALVIAGVVVAIVIAADGYISIN
jgi:hypothetical protein